MINAVNFCGNPAYKAASAVRTAAKNSYDLSVSIANRADKTPGKVTETMGKFVPTAEQQQLMNAQRMALTNNGLGFNHPMVG